MTPAGIFEDIGFISGWIGVVWCTIAFILLTLKAKELLINQVPVNTAEQDKHFRQDTVFLLIHSFGCATFTFMYCAYYATIGTKPQQLHIILTQPLCQYTAQYMANAGWQLSRYCFYNFMLWRIRASFREPEELKLSKRTFNIYVALIHLFLLLALSITVFFTPRILTAQGDCGVLVHNIFAGFTTTDIRTVIWGFDLALTIGLLLLFLRRLHTLTQQNETINAYRRKTVTLGILATSTSIAIALSTYLMVTKDWRFFIPTDLIINLSCVVFTFKFSMDALCPQCCNCIKPSHRNVKTESTYSAQPNDREVWSILVRNGRDTEDCTEGAIGTEVAHPLTTQTLSENGELKI